MVELNDPYGGGYFATRDRWKAREAADADTAYKLALISKSQRDALESARMQPFKEQKMQLELAKLAGGVGKQKLETAQAQNEYVRQRIGPIVMAHSRGELPDMAARAAIEQEVLRARDQFGIGDDEVQMLLQAGPQDWGRYIEQSLPVKEQRAAPPSPELFYQGGTATQKQWNPRTGAYEVVGQRPTFAPNTGTNVTVNLPPQEEAFEKELGKGQAEEILKSRQGALEASEIINTTRIGRELLDSGIISGFGAEALVKIGQALRRIGFDVGTTEIENTQAYAATMASNVGKLIAQFGAGTGLSDADREYAEKMAGGKITLDEAALRRILEINEKAAKNVIEQHNRRASGIKTNIPLTVDYGGAPAEYGGGWSIRPID